MNRSKYPFSKLNNGQSFFVPCKKEKQKNRIWSMRTISYRQCGKTKKFIYKVMKNGIRVYRIKKPKIKTYKIERGIKIPPYRIQSRYPIPLLKIGESFFVKCKREHTISYKRALSSIVSQYKKTNHGRGKNFTLRIYENGIRIWRISKIAHV